MRQGKLNFVTDANLSAKWLPEEGKLKITEDRIWQESSVYNYDMDWKMIMSYSIDDRYLFLNTRRQPDYGIAINKEKLDEREYASLLKFLHKSGLREK